MTAEPGQRRGSGAPPLHQATPLLFPGAQAPLLVSGEITASMRPAARRRHRGRFETSRSAEVTVDTHSHLWPSAEDRTRAAALELLAPSRGLVEGDGG